MRYLILLLSSLMLADEVKAPVRLTDAELKELYRAKQEWTDAQLTEMRLQIFYMNVYNKYKKKCGADLVADEIGFMNCPK